MIDHVTPTLAALTSFPSSSAPPGVLLLLLLLHPLPSYKDGALEKYSLTVDKPALKNFLNLLTLFPRTSLRLKKNHVRARVVRGYR